MYNYKFSEYLSRLDSFDAMTNILRHPKIKLGDFQSADLVRCLYEQSAVVTYDTGLGKTVLAAGIMKALTNINPSSRFLFIGKKTQKSQTPDKLRDYTGFNTLAVTAKESDVFDKIWGQRLEQYKIIFMTFQTLNNPYVMRYLKEYLWAFNCIFVDEVHGISNFMESSSALMLRAVLRNFQYRYGLTATPITSNVEQLANLAHMFDPVAFADVKTLYTDLGMGRDITRRRPGMFINRNRSDLGFDTNFDTRPLYLEPMPHQVGARGMQVTMTTKGPGAVVQAEAMTNIVLERKAEKMRGLIYINYHEVREWLLPFLERAGLRVGCINGRVNDKDRELVETEFNSGQLDVVITSVTESLDLECDYVSFYEFSSDIKQMIGRAHRGLNPKNLILDFIFTKGTGEVDYFIEYIYKTSLQIQQIIGKDYKEIVDAGEHLVAYGT